MYFNVIGYICGSDYFYTVMSTILLEFKRKTSNGRQAVNLRNCQEEENAGGEKRKAMVFGSTQRSDTCRELWRGGEKLKNQEEHAKALGSIQKKEKVESVGLRCQKDRRH